MWVKTACQVVHGHGTHSGHEDTGERTARRHLDGVEESAQVSLTVGLLTVSGEMLLIGEYLVGEMVVLVDEEIYLLANLQAFCAEKTQLANGIVALRLHAGYYVFGKILLVDVAEIQKHKVAGGIHPLLIVIQSRIDHGKVEMYDEILVMLRRRVLTDIKLSEKTLELVSLVDVVVIFEHGEGKALAEAARAYVEEVHVRLFYILYEWGLVHIVAIPFHNILKALHTIRYALAVNPLSSFPDSHSLNMFVDAKIAQIKERTK